MPVFRPATAADIGAIRDLQIASWRRAYRGILSDAFLGDEVASVLGARWSVLPGDDWIVETAWRGDALAGFISVDRSRAGGPYVDNLHVAAAAQGHGTGRALMARAARLLAGEGAERLWLTVIRENRKTRRFYRDLGGIEGREQREMLFGQPVVTLPVTWCDLAALSRLAAPR